MQHRGQNQRNAMKRPFNCFITLPFTPVCPGCGDPINKDGMAWMDGVACCHECFVHQTSKLGGDIGVMRTGFFNRHVKHASGLWFWWPKRDDMLGHGVAEIMSMIQCGSMSDEFPPVVTDKHHLHEVEQIAMAPVLRPDPLDN